MEGGKSMPRSGHVSQLRQNWSVFEDEALATKIQHDEINQHYHGNRNRNQQIREDIPQARRVQSIEEQNAQQEHNNYKLKLDELAERDSQLARELAWTQESEFESHAQYEAKRDEVFARNLQRIEQEFRHKQRHANTNQDPSQNHTEIHDMSYHELGGGLQYNDEQYKVQMARPAMITEEPVYANNINGDTFAQRGHFTQTFPHRREKGEPSKTSPARGDTNHNTSSDTSTSGGRSSRTSSRSRSSVASTSCSDMGACGGASSLTPDPNDILGIGAALSPAELKAAEAAERLYDQERKDMQIAKQLQEQLSLSDEDPFKQDRMLAVEAQDHEFAKILQAKEKAKAKRAREKAKQKKLERQRLEAETIAPRGDPDAINRASEQRPTSVLDNKATSSREQDQTKDDLEKKLSPRSPRSPDIKPPSRKPYMHAEAIDSHVNDTYCKTQITPTPSSESDEHEPHYANIGKNGEPLREEPILHIPTSQSANGMHSPRQPSVLDTDMPIPPYMPMQSSTTKKSASLERKIKKKKEKEGCKQQ